MKKKEKTTLRKIEYHKKESLYLIVRGIEVGIVSGLVSSLYRFLLQNAESLLTKISEYAKESALNFVLWFVALAVMGVIVARIVKWEPMASGSGIPQVNGEIKGELSQNWIKVTIAKLARRHYRYFGRTVTGQRRPQHTAWSYGQARVLQKSPRRTKPANSE